MALRCKYSVKRIFDKHDGKFIAFDSVTEVSDNLKAVFAAHPNTPIVGMVFRITMGGSAPAFYVAQVAQKTGNNGAIVADQYLIRQNQFYADGFTQGGIKIDPINAGDHPFPPADPTFVCTFAACLENFIAQAAETQAIREGGSHVDKMAKATLADLNERSTANHPLDRNPDSNAQNLIELVQGPMGLDGANLALNAAYPDYVGGRIAWYYASKALVLTTVQMLVQLDMEPPEHVSATIQLHLNICRVAKQCRSREEFDEACTKLVQKVSVAPSTARQAIGDMNQRRTKAANNTGGGGRGRGAGRGGKGFFSNSKGMQCFKCSKHAWSGHQYADPGPGYRSG